MTKLALVSCDPASRGRYLCGRDLPVQYMADFSILGFLVDRYHEACSILRKAGYALEPRNDGTEIIIGSRMDVAAIRNLLTGHSIRCEFADVADTIYQA
jgi:hypothetical protein